MRPQDTQMAAGRDVEPETESPGELGELAFHNWDARPRRATIRCDRASVPLIMAWYGSYYAGDRYTVSFDGKQLQKDQNGELIPLTP